jgi:hypothetical protein
LILAGGDFSVRLCLTALVALIGCLLAIWLALRYLVIALVVASRNLGINSIGAAVITTDPSTAGTLCICFGHIRGKDEGTGDGRHDGEAGEWVFEEGLGKVGEVRLDGHVWRSNTGFDFSGMQALNDVGDGYRPRATQYEIDIISVNKIVTNCERVKASLDGAGGNVFCATQFSGKLYDCRGSIQT